jgi:hypothetical protein
MTILSWCIMVDIHTRWIAERIAAMESIDAAGSHVPDERCAIDEREVIGPIFDPVFLEGQYFRWINVCGPRGAGKTAFLRALMKHFGTESATSESSAQDEGRTYPHQGIHPIIHLDFSGFCARTYEDALAHVKARISYLYLSHLDSYTKARHHFTARERYLDVLEGTCDQKDLESSLKDMVYALERPMQAFERVRPMIFIDEVSRPLLYAAGHGYLAEMQSFMDALLDIDHYELTGGIVTTSYAPANVDVHFTLPYLHDVPVNDVEPLAEHCKRVGIELETECSRSARWIQEYHFDTHISLEECFQRLEADGGARDHDSVPASIELDEKTAARIKEMRERIESQRRAAIEAQRKQEEREIREYAAPLPDACRELVPSKFAGVRQLHKEAANPSARDELNELLKRLYSAQEERGRSRGIYQAMQGIDSKDTANPGISRALHGLEEYVLPQGTFPKCRVEATDRHWGRFDYERREDDREHSDLALVKAYLSPLDSTRTAWLFENVVRFLVTEGSHRFHAKVSRIKRSDQICLWVSREDFFALERHVTRIDIPLCTPLPFTAYRGDIGISRELASWNSHNGVQASLIGCYLDGVDSEKDVDVLDMYAQYVSAWNGDLPKDHPMSKEFRNASAQELLILLETLDVLLGNSEIVDNSLLLNGDASLWHALGSARNWYKLGQQLLGCQKKDTLLTSRDL